MASSAITAVQLGRWEGLRSSIELFETSMALDTDATTRHASAELMLQALQDFTGAMFDFFEDGFEAGPGAGDSRLVPGNVTPEYVFSLLGDQVSYDVDAVVRGYMQRRLMQGSPAVGADQPGVNARSVLMRQKGGQLDLLAYSILTAAMEAGVVTRPATVFTYFQKSMRIRLLPYVRVALIGVPYSALSNAYDWLAVAHEVGHYVYRSSVLDDEDKNDLQELRSDTQKANRWFAPWLDEIAADVFGCMVAGPRIAWSFQELSLQAPKKRMVAGDGHHPAPALRPYVYIDTLKELASRWGINLATVIGRLETAWAARVAGVTEVHVPKAPPPVGPGEAAAPAGTELRPIEQVREEIRQEVIVHLLERKRIKQLVELLNPASGGVKYLFQELWGRADAWNDVTHETAGDLLVSEAELPDRFAAAGMYPELEQNGNLISVSAPPGSALAVEELGPGETKTRFDTLRDQLAAQDGVLEEEWSKLLTFGGWIDVGPPGAIPHG